MSKTTSIIPNSVDDPNKQFTPKAYISIKSDGKRCLIKFKGNTVELADMVYTAMRQNEQLAAVICHVARDFMDAAKASTKDMQTLAENYGEVHRKLANRYHRKTSQPAGSGPAKTAKEASATPPETTSDRKEA
jgi:hypothetical protein